MGDNFHVKLKLATVTSYTVAYTGMRKSVSTEAKEHKVYDSNSEKIMFNDSWIYLNHRRRVYKDTVQDSINFFIERNAETEKVVVVYSIVVWNERGIELIQKNFTTTFIDNMGYGFDVDNIPADHTHLTCILQIKDWKAIPINRPQG